MTTGHIAKRACTPSARKNLVQTTKDICMKKLSELTEDELKTYLKVMGWPKAISPAVESYAEPGNFIVWILNRMLTQLKKWMTLRTSGKLVEEQDESKEEEMKIEEHKGDIDMVEKPTIFRTMETKLVAYLVGYTGDINALYSHSHVLIKMATFNNTLHTTRLAESHQHKANNPGIQMMKATDAEQVLEQYRDSVEAVNALIKAIYYQSPPLDTTPREGNRICVALSLNEMAEKFIDDVNMFVVWNQAFQTITPTHMNKSVATYVADITSSILEHMGIVAGFLREQLDESSNVKNAYNCVAQTLMAHVLFVRAEIDDFKRHSKVIMKKHGNVKEGHPEKLDQKVNAAVNSMMRLLAFTWAPKFVNGLKQMIKAKEYEDLLDMEQLGNMDLDDSTVTYNRRLLLNIVKTIHHAETDKSVIQHGRGLCILLPDIFEALVDAVDVHTRNQQETTYCGAMMLALILPLIIRLIQSTLTVVDTQPETFVHYVTLLDLVSSLYNILKVANNKHILVHAGDRSDLVVKTNRQVITFVLDTLTAVYAKVAKSRKRKTMMENCDEDDDAIRVMMKRAHLASSKYLDVTSEVHTIPRLWDALLLLVSLSLEYADENMEQIMHLLYQDAMLDDTDYHQDIFNMLIKPQISLEANVSYRSAQLFAANLVSMYSIANDMPSLLDHMGEFVEKKGRTNKQYFYMAHPPAICAFYNSSKESSTSQIPIVIQHFAEWLKKKHAFKALQYPLMCYLSGVEFSSTLVAKSEDALDEIIYLVPLEPTPEGVLMAIQLICAIRKINSWSSGEDSTQRWNGHINILYRYVQDLTENVGRDCSSAIWTAMFWFAYHLILIIRDNPDMCGSMSGVVDLILDKMDIVVQAHADEKDFMETANTLLMANAHVFSHLSKFTGIIKCVCVALLKFEKDAGLLDSFRETIEVLGRDRELINEVLDINFLQTMLAVTTKQGAMIDLKLKSIHIIRQVLENASGLYRNKGISKLFQSLVEVANVTAANCDMKCEEDVIFLKSVLEVMNFILGREEQLGMRECAEVTVADCFTSLKGEQGLSVATQKDAILTVGLLKVLDDVKNALDLNCMNGLQTSLKVMQQLAKICVFVMGKMYSEDFMGSLDIKTSHEERNACIGKILATITTGAVVNDEQVATGEDENMEPLQLDSGSRSLADILLFVNIIKTLQDSNPALLDTAFTTIGNLGQVTDILSEMANTLNSNKQMDQERLLYLSCMLYCTASNVQNTYDEAALKQVSKLHESVKVLTLLSPAVLEALNEAILEVVYRIVPHASEKQIQAHAVHALFLMATMQHIICYKRRGVLGFGADQLEVFKTLCGCQVDKVSGIVQTILENTEPRNTWKNFATHLENIYNRAESHPTPYNWIFRAACLEVMMLMVDKNHLKTIYGIKGAAKKKILGCLDGILGLHSKQLECLSCDMDTCRNKEIMHWVILNYLINIAISIKILGFTRFQVNKYMQEAYGVISEHLLDLSRLGLHFLGLFKTEAASKTLFEQIATNVYIALYHCIRTAEGMSSAQIAKLVRPWMKRVHVVTYVITRFVSLLDEQDADMFAYVARWMSIISHSQLVDATKWYIPHIVTSVAQAWYHVNKAIATNRGNQAEVIRSNKILKSCVIESIGACDYHAVKTLFLLLTPEMRAFMKENTNVFSRS
ncbi:uncharacterized protein BXIN_1472 [Babesia sp. Xinjiang]|uniref:uncharacterized protein n=1 Tax=Babesia sp. Xinjiang TaxID=462227 RepID=UPI000A22E07C|nr:uncharacterized protein BXIN_1472 [Babesia sp. Xinjiang]ORM40016.1 hypothetical protein BXIN_1472 [Babesia sp. Xinjiang]